MCLCPFGIIKAQQDVAEKYLEVRGTSELEMSPLARATANLYEGSTKVKSIQTGADGSFSFKLEINKQYTIEVEKDGLVSKRISFNTQMPDQEKGTWMNEFSIGLVRPCSGMDYSVLKEPVDQVSFDPKRREFISNKEYVNRMRPRIESLMIKNDQCLLNSYEDLVKKADQTAGQKNYQEAINTYREALKIYPTEEYPAKRITEINALINKQQNSSVEYKKVITDADALSSQGKYTEALQKYKQAAALNPQESYPRQKAAEIESSLAQQQAAKQAQMSTEEKYNQAMAKASVANTRKDYATAKQYYQEALQIKPSESLPKTRLQEIETIQAKKAADDAAKSAETARKADFEKEYLSVVAQADALFKAKKYDEAKASYIKASNMKPSESYPAQRVKTIDNAVASAQATLQKNNENGYDDAMSAGNNALAKNQFQQAKDAYAKALTFKPDDLAAKSKLAEVDKLSGEFAKRKNQEEQYANLIQSGDAFMAQKDLTKAKDSYSQALQLKPGDKYAQTRITAIDNTVAAEQSALLKSQNEKYNAALSAGNNALAQNQFSLAKESFQKALAIKPDDQIAKNRILETDRLAAEFTKQKSLDEQYRKVIQTADGLLAAKDLAKARESYMQALSLRSGDTYAQTKITTIDNTLAAEQAAKIKATEEGYKAAIGAANTAIAQKTYSQAKEFLKKALAIKPGDVYATNKNAEVDRLIQEQQKKTEQEQQINRQYTEVVAAADKSFTSRDWVNARLSYNKALQLKPGDAYASQKISAIESALAAELAEKQKQTEESYKSAMDKGSKALIAKDYSSAREAFQQALVVKPGDSNAKTKLGDTELLIKQDKDRAEAEKARRLKYDETVKNADLLFTQKNFQGAKTSYEQAIAMMPAENYPRKKLEETINAIAEQERIIAENKAKENAYNLALVNGDKYYRSKDLQQAKDEYSRALTIKPNEALPKTRLAEIENLILAEQKQQAAAKAKADGYTAAINAGNVSFGKKDYPAAKVSYTEALKYIPGDVLASDQIKKIDYIMAEAEKVNKAAQEKKAAYDALIASADKQFDGAKYAAAKEEYKKALVIDPGSTYAKQRITRIDEITRMLAQSTSVSKNQSTPVTTKVVAAIPMGELNFKNESERQKYLDELKSKYPPGITLEKYKEQYKETWRYIIIRENQAQEFRQVKFTTYSGSQYSVNGKPITQQYFLSQTKTREGETFKEIMMQ